MKNFGLPAVYQTDTPVITVGNVPATNELQTGDVIFMYYEHQGLNVIGSHPLEIKREDGAHTLAGFVDVKEENPDKQGGIPLGEQVFWGVIRDEHIYKMDVTGISAYPEGGTAGPIIAEPTSMYILSEMKVTDEILTIFSAPYFTWILEQLPVLTIPAGTILKRSISSVNVYPQQIGYKNAPDYKLTKYVSVKKDYVEIRLKSDLGVSGEFIYGYSVDLLEGAGSVQNDDNTIRYLFGDDNNGDIIKMKINVLPMPSAPIETPPFYIFELTIKDDETPDWQTDQEYFDLLEFAYNEGKLTIQNKGILEGYLQIQGFHNVSDNLQEIFNQKIDETFENVTLEIPQKDGYLMIQVLRMGKFINSINYGTYIEPEPVPEPEPELNKISLPELTYGNFKQQMFANHNNSIEVKDGMLSVKTSRNYCYPFVLSFKYRLNGAYHTEILATCPEGYINDSFLLPSQYETLLIVFTSNENSRFSWGKLL